MTTVRHEPSLHRPAGSAAEDPWSVVVTPDVAGWNYSGLRVTDIARGGEVTFDTGEDEAIVVPLAGAARISCGGETAALTGRAGPFSGPSDFAYLPRESSVTLQSQDGGRFAVATARSERLLPFRHSAAAVVPIEQRGAGACAREVRNFAAPAAFEADRLIVVEVVTPGGNWSSYPPHKHDTETPTEAALEEIYYYEIAPGPHGPGIGYQRVYGTPGRPIDLLVEVRHGDVVLIPHGWHGPSMAAPGYDMYYLNVMAGPGAERAWRITDDPAHAWVRETWGAQQAGGGDAVPERSTR